MSPELLFYQAPRPPADTERHPPAARHSARDQNTMVRHKQKKKVSDRRNLTFRQELAKLIAKLVTTSRVCYNICIYTYTRVSICVHVYVCVYVCQDRLPFLGEPGVGCEVLKYSG